MPDIWAVLYGSIIDTCPKLARITPERAVRLCCLLAKRRPQYHGEQQEYMPKPRGHDFNIGKP